MGGHGQSAGPSELTWFGLLIRIVQYLLGFFISGCAIFLEFYGMFWGFSEITFSWGVPGWGVFLIIIGLLIILAYCEATQVALMILEKVDSAELGEGFFMEYAKKTHALAKANVNNYLIGRQTFVTFIVMLTASMIHLDHSYHYFALERLGPFFGSEAMVGIFVDTGLCGSLILLAFGQLIPELLVTTNPTFQFRLPPAYEIIWLNLWCERLGICQFSEVLASFTRWALDIKDNDPMAAGNETKIGAAGGNAVSNRDDPDSAEYKLRNSFWPKFFRDPIPMWWLVYKYIFGTLVWFASVFGVLWNVLTGMSPWCTFKYFNKDSTNWYKWENDYSATFDGRASVYFPDPVFSFDPEGKNICTDMTKCLHPHVDFDTNGMPIADHNVEGVGDVYGSAHCIIPRWVLLVFITPVISALLMFLEGSQIAVLALEKAPGRRVKRLHRPAYFGHKVSQQRDNVRRYLLGRQFLVVFGDFVASKIYGVYGIGYIVIIEVYPRLVALRNPMFWLGTWGSRFVLLLALFMEFIGFTHFAWGLYWCMNKFIRCALGVTDDAFSVGESVAVSGKDDALEEATPNELRDMIYNLREQIAEMEAQQGGKAVTTLNSKNDDSD